ncbi:MAG: hypothetical protein N2749_04560 [Clostridia bacterium]|nr:hypothetical protein [Clostridia bacterium]
MKVKIDNFFKEEFNKIKLPYDFSNEMTDIFKNKKHSNTLKYRYFQIAACIFILLIGLSTFYVITKQKRSIDNTLINSNIEKSVNSSYEKYNNKQPYRVISFSSSRAYDITNIENLYKNVDIVVTGKVIEKNEAKISKTIPIIHTPGKLTISNVIKGSIKNKDITFIVPGGKVSLEYYENSIKDIYSDNILKEDFSNLDNNFKKQNYILYKDEYSNNFFSEQDYVMFLNKIEITDEYAVISYAGMIPINDASKISSIDQVYNLEKVKKD